MIGFDKIILYTQGWARNFKNVAPQKQNAICKLRAQYAKCNCTFKLFKGIVQRKLRWVKSGVNRRVLLQYGGAAL